MDAQNLRIVGLIGLLLIISSPLASASTLSWIMNPDTNRRDFMRLYNTSDFLSANTTISINETDPIFTAANATLCHSDGTNCTAETDPIFTAENSTIARAGSTQCAGINYFLTNITTDATGITSICTLASGGGGTGGWTNTSVQTHTELTVNISNGGNTSLLYVNTTTNKVGIGTNTPEYVFVVNGDGELAGVAGYFQMMIRSNANNRAGLLFADPRGVQSGIRLNSAGNLEFDGFINGAYQSTALVIKQNGDVGIGTGSPLGKFHTVTGAAGSLLFFDYASMPTIEGVTVSGSALTPIQFRGSKYNFVTDTDGVGINDATPDAQLDVEAAGATDVVIIAKGAAAQSANLQEWQNSSGGIVAAVNAAGYFYGNSIEFSALDEIRAVTPNEAGYIFLDADNTEKSIKTSAGGWNMYVGTSTKVMGFTNGGTTEFVRDTTFAPININFVPLTVKSGVGVQVANLTEWTNSSGDGVLTSVSAKGYFNIAECAGSYAAGDVCYNSTSGRHMGYNGTLNRLY